MTDAADDFLDAVAGLASSFGWRVQSFTRGDQCIAAAGFDGDDLFEQLLWIHDPATPSLRCLLTVRPQIPPGREAAILELCARINDGLTFGCLEYDFSDQSLAFRDASELSGVALEEALQRTTSRVLSLGVRYLQAIESVLAGNAPVDAVANVEQLSP